MGGAFQSFVRPREWSRRDLGTASQAQRDHNQRRESCSTNDEPDSVAGTLNAPR